MNDAGECVIRLRANHEDDGEISTYSAKGKDLMELGATANGQVTVTTFQPDGNELVALGATEGGGTVTFHRWKRKYGDMDVADAKRLKELEKENAELKKMLAESLLKNRVLEEVNAKKW